MRRSSPGGERVAVPTVHLEEFKEMGWHRAIDADGFAIRPGRFSHEWLDRLLQAIHELAPQPSRAGVRHALRPAPIAEFARRSERINFCATSSRAGCISISRGALRQVSQIELASCGIRSLLCRWRSRLEITGWGTGSVTGNSRGTCVDKRSAPSSGIAGELR